MTIQEARDFFATSDFSDETKAKIAAVFENKPALDERILQAVKALMQEELNKDFAETGIDISGTPEVKEIEAAYNEELGAAEAELKEDLDFVETKLKGLDDLRKQVAKASDHADAAAIRATM